MNLKIDASNNQNILNYQIEVLSGTAAFDTTIILKGTFGSVRLQQVELPHCHVWIASHELSQTITIRGTGDLPVLQLLFPLPPMIERPRINLKEAPSLLPSLHLHYTYDQQPCFQLERHSPTSLIINFGPHFFSPEQAAMLSFIQQVHQQSDPGCPGLQTGLSLPMLLVLQQIIGFPLEDAHLPRYLRAKTEELLVHFLKSAEALYHTYQLLSPGELEKIQQVKNIIHAAPGESFSDFDLAKRVGMNAYTLKKKFKLLTGITTAQFILKSRMETAEQRLADSDVPVKTIAFELGYKNLSNFSESFKKYFGYPPNAVRKKNERLR